MAATDKRIAELTAAVSIDDDDLVPGYRPSAVGTSNADLKIPVGLIRQAVADGLPGAYDGVLSGQTTFDASSLLMATGQTTTVTVTGAALGDFVTGVSHSVDLQGITVTAWVSAADTVTIRFQNNSSGTIDLASGALRVVVTPKAAFGL